MQIKKLETMTSRTGRHMQRYYEGSRQVVGCIPFRFKKTKESTSVHGTLIDDLEVLLISSQKSPKMMFPKGGWETDETIEEAAKRETLEEAGVLGEVVGENLGVWSFKSKSQGTYHQGYMLPLFVKEELDNWPEKDVRKRTWMTLAEASERCSHLWMKEALDAFICQLMLRQITNEEHATTCLSEFLRTEEPKIGIVAQSGDEEVGLC